MLNPFNPTPGLVVDDTSRLAANRWKDADGIRFFRGHAQALAGFERFADAALTGVCRNLFPWTDNSDQPNVAFGTHSNLEVQTGGLLADITPTLNLPSRKLAANPFSMVNGSPTVTVNDPNHLMNSTETVTYSGAVAGGGLTLNGTFAVTVVNANSYTITAGGNATATTTGGGSAVVEAPQQPFSVGNIDGLGGAGFGTGAFSTGTFSSPSGVQYYPRTWSFDAWGQNLLACPRGGTIYLWQNATGTPVAPLANAPPQVVYMLVAPGKRQVLALGCSRELDDLFNPLAIRGCDLEDLNDWTSTPTNNAFEHVLEGSGRIVAGRAAGDNVLVWTDSGIYLGTFTGNTSNIWTFDKVGDKCGLIGPNAATVIGSVAYWMAPNGQLWTYAVGGQPSLIISPITALVVKNIAASQQDKIVLASIVAFSSLRLYYPDGRDGNEISRWLEFDMPNGVNAPVWWRGSSNPRTAFADASAAYNYPLGVSFAGLAYLHEKGVSADGGALAVFIESTDQFIDDTQGLMFVRGFRPDFLNQQGAVSLTVFMRDDIQAVERSYGPFMCAPGQSRVDFRAQGRLARVRFDGNGSPLAFRLGVGMFDADPNQAKR